MKKLFTIDDFIIAFISALVYGLSFEIPILLGWGGMDGFNALLNYRRRD